METSKQNDTYSLESLNDFKVFATIAAEAKVNEYNRLDILGAGLDQFMSPIDSTAPYTITNIGIGLFLTVPWSKTDQEHTIVLRLVDEDSRPVSITADDGQSERSGDLSLSFNIHRAHILDNMGSEVKLSSALNISNVSVGHLGRYTFLISIDDVEYMRLPFTMSKETL